MTPFQRAFIRTVKERTVAWRQAYPENPVPSMQDIYRLIQSGKVKEVKRERV